MKKIFYLFLISIKLFSQEDKILKEIFSNDRVLFVALQPGFESIEKIIKQRRIGAKIKIVFITNGESSINYKKDLLPEDIAIDLRKSSYLYSKNYEYEIEFMNFKDLQSEDYFVENSTKISNKINDIIKEFTPTKIIFEPDYYYENQNRINLIIKNTIQLNSDIEVESSVYKYKLKKNNLSYNYYEDYKEINKSKNINNFDAVKVGRFSQSYDISFLNEIKQIKNINEKRKLNLITSYIEKVTNKIKETSSKYELNVYKNILYNLEDFKNELLNVKISATLKDSNICNLQYTKLKIENLNENLVGDYFLISPKAKESWVINESHEVLQKINFPTDVDLISPNNMNLTKGIRFDELPTTFKNNFGIVIACKNENVNYSYTKRFNFEFDTPPKMITLNEKPIVYYGIDKKINLNITNYSNDKLKDKVYIKSDYVVSDTVLINLDKKDSKQDLVLNLKWLSQPDDTITDVACIIGNSVLFTFKIKNLSEKIYDIYYDVESEKENSNIKNLFENLLEKKLKTKKIKLIESFYLNEKKLNQIISETKNGYHIIFLNNQNYNISNKYFRNIDKGFENQRLATIFRNNFELKNQNEYDEIKLFNCKFGYTKMINNGRITFLNYNLSQEMYNLNNNIIELLKHISELQ